MSVRIRAAVAWEAGAKLSIAEFDLDDPRDDEILVRVEATGVCHTDESSRLGLLPVVYPIILGHEGSGTVEAAGQDVTRVKPGDKVLFTPDYCGTCEQCVLGHTPYCERVIPVTFTGTRPDGRILNTFMPWPYYAQMTDDELKGIWQYLQAVPPRATGNR